MKNTITQLKPNNFLKLFLLSSLLISLSFLNYSQAQPAKYLTVEGKAAFGGYDLVSYFQSPIPAKGKTTFSFEYEGLELLFSSVENRNSFKTNPDKYLPAYGGYCATAVTSGNFIEPNFAQFQIQGDRLMFFEVRGFFNGKTQWNKNPELHELLANEKYDKLVLK